MGTLLVLKKEEEKFEEVEVCLETVSSPAIILDFNAKFQKKLEDQRVSQWAEDGLEVLRVVGLDYEKLMRALADQISSEDLAKVTELSAEEQINEDIRRIQDLIHALEARVKSRVGLSLEQAFEEIKNEEGEVATVAAYLEQNGYALFQVMMKVISWASVKPEEMSVEEVTPCVQSLVAMGACDTASALVFLQSRIH